MNIVLTGALSFAGCHLAAGYRQLGAEVTAIVSSNRERAGIEAQRRQYLERQGVRWAAVDLTDPEAVRRLGGLVRPDVWVQHAGYTKNYGGWNYDLERGLAINVLPLTSIYEMLGDQGGALILTGSVSEYQDSDEAHRESECCAPAMPYGLSKLTATLRAQQLAAQYGVATRVARLFLPIGPLDAPGKLLPSAISSLKHRKPIDLSPCEQRRDFLHIDDVVTLYQRLIDDFSRSNFEIYNVCAGESPRLKELLRTCCDVLRVDPGLCRFGAIPMRAGEPSIVQGSSAKAQANLQWDPGSWKDAIIRLCEAE